MDSPKYAKFNILEVTYKVFNNQNINAYIFVPKDISPGKHPILAKFHGGFFFTGSSIFPDWFAQWTLDLCLAQSAIIVAADYRLLPESSGQDILDDVSDFWAWILQGGLQTHLTKHNRTLEADLTKIAIHGESAGGRLAILSPFNIVPPGTVRAVVATYPYIGTSPRPSKPILDTPDIPVEVLESHLKAMKPGKIVTSAFPPSRMDIAVSMAQQGRLVEFLGSDEKLYPLKLVEYIDEQRVPPMVLMHGTGDTAVPVSDSIEFVEKLKKRFGEGRVRLHLEEGAEHGFDNHIEDEVAWLENIKREFVGWWIS
ncbi:Alpha/Beta hydrolase protein [Xylogone sp. PMI_703]|nr:Alpha/Beta hydrolase protein [Xylogone sp. PMI_703]